MSILLEKARDILMRDYDIGKIIDRTEETNLLKKWLNTKMNLIYIYGGSGTGKTFIINKILEEKVKGENPYLIYLYLNCKNIKSFHEIIIKCLEKLKEKGFIDDFPLRGMSTTWFLGILQEKIERNGIFFYLVVDEINRLKEKDIDDIMYIGLEAQRYYKMGWLYTIVISNDPMLDSRFSDPVKSRLSIKIHFPRYNIQQLLEILEEYAKISLKENSYSREDLFKIAEYVGNLSGDIRTAKRLMYFIAEKSEEKFDISKIKDAINENEKYIWEREIERLSLELRLSLLAVIEANKFYEKEREILMTDKSLRSHILSAKIQPIFRNVYKKYCEICFNYGLKPKSEFTFRYLIDELEKQMLVKREVRGLGRARGVTSLIYLVGFADILEPIVRTSIEKFLGM
jgi:Cdc6-like AAA superfamily ATPase